MWRIGRRGFSTETLHNVLKSNKVAELKQICAQSGVLMSGNKTDLVQRLVLHFDSVKDTKDACASILSFDLGYRNLAYCHLDKDANILDWARVDLDLPSFHPSVVAPVVRQFIHDRVLNSLKETDRVVVEQQRARTSGAHTVLEATLRVNCVEAILWGGLYEAVDLIKRPDIKMVPLPRQVVDKTWQLETDSIVAEHPDRFKKIKAGYYHKKQVGTLLVQKWLDTNTVVQCPDHFKTMFQNEKKKDDLSDCLIQALTWYKWDAYSKKYIKHLYSITH